MAASKYRAIDYRQAVERVYQKLRDHQPLQISPNGARLSAVMILFVNKENVPYLVFTKRTELVEHHKGQISFPGGARDTEDRTILRTALRETHEEIGIAPEEVKILGQADDFFTVTNFLVTPFIGTLEQPYRFTPNHDEVAEVIEVPLSLFLDDAHFEVKKWDYRGRGYDVYFYYYHHHVIWGATAFILNRFLDVVFEYNPAPNPVTEDPRNEEYLNQNKIRGSSR